MSKIDEMISRNPALAIGVAVGFLLLLSILGFVIYRQMTGPQKMSEISVIEFVDGQNEVIVNRNGNVKVNTPYGSFSQNWDKNKVDDFFANANRMNLNNLTNFVGSDVTIGLTYDSGKKVTAILSEVDKTISDTMQKTLENAYEEYNLLPEWQRDVYLGQVRKINNTNDDTSDTVVNITGGSNSVPTPIPNPDDISVLDDGVEIDYQVAGGCDDINDDEQAKKTVIGGESCDRKGD